LVCAKDPKDDFAPNGAAGVALDRARPRPPAKGEEKELAWPKAGMEEEDEDMAPRREGWPNVGVLEEEEGKLVPGVVGSGVAPRMEGWPKVGWLGARVEDMDGGGGRDEVLPRMEVLEPKVEVGCWPNVETED